MLHCGSIEHMQVHDQLDRMDAQQLRSLAAELMVTLADKDRDLQSKDQELQDRSRELLRFAAAETARAGMGCLPGLMAPAAAR